MMRPARPSRTRASSVPAARPVREALLGTSAGRRPDQARFPRPKRSRGSSEADADADSCVGGDVAESAGVGQRRDAQASSSTLPRQPTTAGGSAADAALRRVASLESGTALRWLRPLLTRCSAPSGSPGAWWPDAASLGGGRVSPAVAGQSSAECTAAATTKIKQEFEEKEEEQHSGWSVPRDDHWQDDAGSRSWSPSFENYVWSPPTPEDFRRSSSPEEHKQLPPPLEDHGRSPSPSEDHTHLPSTPEDQRRSPSPPFYFMGCTIDYHLTRQDDLASEEYTTVEPHVTSLTAPAVESPATDVCRCQHCSYACLDQNRMEHHMRFRHGGVGKARRYMCRWCSYASDNITYIKSHERRHTGERPFRCDTCGKAFRMKHHLTNHVRSHTGARPYVCDVCSKAFPRWTSLDLHRAGHAGVKQLACEWCGVKFDHVSKLRRHMRCHVGEKSHKCPTCSTEFRARSKLVIHMRLHAEKQPFSCPFCGMGIVRQSNMKAHIIARHPKEYERWRDG